MADIEPIDRNELKKEMHKVHIDTDTSYGYGVMKGLNFAFEVVENAPTVDAVPVVRCKDCKHQEDCIGRIQFWGRDHVLELNTTEYHPLDFCSYGERKEQ